MPEIEFADLQRSDSMPKKEKNGWLRGIGIQPNLFGELKKTVQNTTGAKGFLKFEELMEAWKNGQQITWHPEFPREEWKDGDAPLIIDDVHKMGGAEGSDQVYVHHTCSRPDCHSCHHGNPDLYGHHIIMETGKWDGMVKYGKVTELVTKKKTFTVLHPAPVFKVLE